MEKKELIRQTEIVISCLNDIKEGIGSGNAKRESVMDLLVVVYMTLYQLSGGIKDYFKPRRNRI